eukprot:GHVL01041879.1.p1 GENE.GHVL01041879.1~~GHVL01041879.1.p1  ORF type:complete len:144 (-),score=27.59 GHVL01041879.1:244-675(-)
MTKLEFFFDVVSPYSYFAFKSLRLYQKSKWKNIEIIMKPIFLGGLFKEIDSQPPGQFQPKAKYMLQDLPRLAAPLGIPIKFPQKFPVNSLKAMRILLKMTKILPFDDVCNVSELFWKQLWEDGLNFEADEDILAILQNVNTII